MRATPIQTATTAVIATTCGLLSAWPIPNLLPAIAIAVIAYLATVGLAARLLHLAPGQLVADTTRLAIRVTATTITVLAGLLLNWLARFDHTIATAQQHTTTRTVRSTTA